jgi:hypothetical protein
VHVQRERRQHVELRAAEAVGGYRDTAGGSGRHHAFLAAASRAISARIACPRCDNSFFVASGNSAP